MAFDWQAFLERHGIENTTRGHTHGNVGVRCPFCPDDPSHHMGISLEGKGWRCWRNPQEHRGRSPVRLVQALIGCTIERAREICGATVDYPNDLAGYVRVQLEKPEERKRPPLTMPPEFKRFKDGRVSGRPYMRYLIDERGFSTGDIERMDAWYGLRYCTQGRFRGRIIFPVFYRGDLVTWTGRAILPSDQIRYLTLSDDEETARRNGLPVAVGPITDYLLYYDELVETDCDTLYLTEGPFDAAKVTMLGRGIGAIATCFFTAAPTALQGYLLKELAPRFRRVILLLDRGTTKMAMLVRGLMAGSDLLVQHLPDGVKDPGELTLSQMYRLHDDARKLVAMRT